MTKRDREARSGLKILIYREMPLLTLLQTEYTPPLSFLHHRSMEHIGSGKRLLSYFLVEVEDFWTECNSAFSGSGREKNPEFGIGLVSFLGPPA